jgi:hypothetical protein
VRVVFRLSENMVSEMKLGQRLKQRLAVFVPRDSLFLEHIIYAASSRNI